MHDTTYNGWPNYETWAYALWMDNNEATYNSVRVLAQQVACGEVELYEAVDLLKADMEDLAQDLLDDQPECTVLNDLLISAVQSIDYYHYFKGMVDDIKDDMAKEEEQLCPDEHPGEGLLYYPKDENKYWEDK